MVLHILNERALPNFKLSIDTLTSSNAKIELKVMLRKGSASKTMTRKIMIIIQQIWQQDHHDSGITTSR